MKILKETKLEAFKDNQKLIQLVQYEHGESGVKCYLFDSQKQPIDLSDCLQANYWGTKADDIGINCIVEENTVIIPIKSPMTATPGRIKGVLECIFDNGNIRFYGVNFEVGISPDVDEIESTDDFTVLEKSIAEVQELLKFSDTKLDKPTTDGTAGQVLMTSGGSNEAIFWSTIDNPQTLNVKDFGAVGDGVIDDTEAFRQCFIRAKGNKIIIVPEGTYVVNNCIYEGSISLKGINNPTIIRTIAPTSSADQCMFKFIGVQQSEISGITFDCKRDNFLQEATPAYNIDGSEVTNLTETYQEWINTACIYFFDSGSNIEIHHCNFLNCSREGIYCKGNFENVNIHDNVFKDTSANFWGNGGDFKNISFENNISENCRTMVVEFDNITNEVNNLIVRNNIMLNIAKAAVSVPKGQNLVIENNYYTQKVTLNEHGRSSSDYPLPYFIWFLYTGGTENVINNVIIRNNSGEVKRFLSVYSGSNIQEQTIYNDFYCDNNNFNCSEFGIRGSYINNLKLNNNIINGNSTSAYSGLSLINCANIRIKNSEINDFKYALELTGCKVIDLYENILNSTDNPLLIDENSMSSSNTETQLSVINNIAKWKFVNQSHFAKDTPFNKVGSNIDTSSTISKVPFYTATDTGKYRLYLSSVMDIMTLDATNMTASDTGQVPIFAVTTRGMVGRTIKIIVTGQPIITVSNTGNIINAVEVPVNGILKLTFNGEKWIAEI